MEHFEGGSLGERGEGGHGKRRGVHIGLLLLVTVEDEERLAEHHDGDADTGNDHQHTKKRYETGVEGRHQVKLYVWAVFWPSKRGTAKPD